MLSSLAAEKSDGVRVRRQRYPTGVGGVRLSLDTMATMIREGSLSKKVMGWAADRLRECGLDGRSPNHTNFARACCLLDAVRKKVVYMPDPPGVELIKSAEVTLCLRDDVCVSGADCDCITVALGSVCMAAGIPFRIVKQTFHPDAEGNTPQEHVLGEGQSEDGSWFSMDGSTNLPCGQKLPAASEFRVDPLDPKYVGLSGTSGAELIGIGRPHAPCGDTCCGTSQCSDCATHGKPVRSRLGFGALSQLPASVTIPSGPYAASANDLQNQFLLVIKAGDVYYGEGNYDSAMQSYQAAGTAGVQSVGPEIDLAGAANVTSPMTANAAKLNATLQSIESTTQGAVDTARALVLSMLAQYQTAMAVGAYAIQVTPAGLPPTLTPQVSAVSALGWMIGGGLALGFAWGAWGPKRRGRR